jgi:signal transduction histidine kinase
MKVRTSTIRNRLFALVAVPLASLILLWGVGVYLTFPDGQRLYEESTLVDHVATPMEDFLIAVQGERLASMVYLADPSTANLTALTERRATVNDRITAARTAMGRSDVQRVASDKLLHLAEVELNRLSDLPQLRNEVINRTISPSDLMDAFATLADGLTPLYANVADFPDETVAAEGRSLAALAHAREMLSRQDAVLANALAAGHFTTGSYRMFVQSVAVQRYAFSDMYAGLSDRFKSAYDTVLNAGPFPQLQKMEDTAINHGKPGAAVPVDAGTWNSVNATVLGSLRDLEWRQGNVIEDQAKSPAYVIFIRLGIVTLLGLAAIVVSVVVARRISRRMVRQLRALRDTARDLAWVRLPSVVERLRTSRPVDVADEVPRLPVGTDEIGQVSESFNEVGRTAVHAAAEQSALRAGVAHVFLNIARRSQGLVNSQLRQLDVMERKAVEPESLDDLFKIDHLATRMRRNAENLVILGGGAPGRVFREPVPLLDVLRSAASEGESYERVRVLPFPPVMLAGSVVSDVVHLCAELIDNATSFSPPHTRVQVSGQSVPKGFAVEIEDRGLGMKPDVMDAANRWLEDPPEFDVLALSDDARLGMFVVGRIAARHDIKVHLRDSPYGGTTAIVLLPAELVAESSGADDLRRRDARRAESATPAELVPAGAERIAIDGPAPEPPRVTALPYRPPTAPTSPAYPPAAMPLGPPAGPPGPAGPLDPPDYPRVPAEPLEPLAPLPTRGQHRAPATEPPAPRFREPAPEPVPAPEPAAEREPVSAGTHLGLPRRVRQASLAPGLRSGPPADVPVVEEPATPARSPEEIRKMMSAYQRGTVRGRAAVDSADTEPTRDLAGDPQPPAEPPEPPEPPEPVEQAEPDRPVWSVAPVDAMAQPAEPADPAESAGSPEPLEPVRDEWPRLPVRDRSAARPPSARPQYDDLDKTTELTAIDADREDD